MIEVKGLTKRYGSKLALDNLTFTVEKGQILGLLGPNGAGKTTTMNILTGYLSATEGTVTIDGHEILEEPMKARRKISYLPEQPPLYLDMTVKSYLEFVCQLKKVPKPWKEHMGEITDKIGITDVMDRLIRNLSKGYRQRVGLAQALLGDPEVIILDEPTVGLDPKQITEIRELIRSLGKAHTVILSTHILPEVQAVCDRVMVINAGKIVADNTPDGLSESMSGTHSLHLEVEGEKTKVEKVLGNLPDLTVEALELAQKGVWRYHVKAKEGTDPRRAIFFALADHKLPLLQMARDTMSLEDIFLQLTREEDIEAGEEPEEGGGE